MGTILNLITLFGPLIVHQMQDIQLVKAICSLMPILNEALPTQSLCDLGSYHDSPQYIFESYFKNKLGPPRKHFFLPTSQTRNHLLEQAHALLI